MIQTNSVKDSLTSTMGVVVIVASLVISYFIYYNILGDPSNFVEGDPNNEPLEGNYLGVVYKGSSIVIVQLAFFIILITYTIERGISLRRASGKGRNKAFAQRVKALLANDDFDGVLQACHDQRSSVANILRKGVVAFRQIEGVGTMRPEEKAFRLKRELEEATHLELPHLERNMGIISTIASIATLIGLLGTVTGMIRAFSSLARAGSPDAVGLAGGISQALITTALGISTAAVAIVVYNFYTSTIDKLTYAADETNYAVLGRYKENLSQLRPMPPMRNIRQKPRLDMNPMVDMAFLLVSFFMMTTTFKPELPEEVRIPISSSEVKLPEKGLCTITIGEEGTIYFSIDNKFHRIRLLEMVGAQYGLTFSQNQTDAFSLTGAFGVSAAQLDDFLNARAAHQPFVQEGIPMGENGELRQWLIAARMTNPRLRFAVNADGGAPWPAVHEVFELLRDLNITRFNIVTDQKSNHASSPS